MAKRLSLFNENEVMFDTENDEDVYTEQTNTLEEEDDIKDTKKSQIKPITEDKKDDEAFLDTEDDEDSTEDDDKDIKKEDTKQSSKKQSKPNESNGEIDYKLLYEKSKEKGVFTVEPDEDFDGSEEAFINLTNKEIDSNVTQALQELDGKYNGLLTYLENGGRIEEWIKTEQVFDFEKIKEDDIKNKPEIKDRVLKEYYRNKGFDENRIEKHIRRAKDLETDEEDALDFLKELQDMSVAKKNEIKAQAMESKRREESTAKKAFDTITQTIEKTESFIPNLPLDKRTKAMITQYATSDVIWKELEKDPIKARITLAALKTYGLLDGDWSKISKVLESKVTRNVKNEIIKTTSSGTNSGTPGLNDVKNTADSIINAFKRKTTNK